MKLTPANNQKDFGFELNEDILGCIRAEVASFCNKICEYEVRDADSPSFETYVDIDFWIEPEQSGLEDTEIQGCISVYMVIRHADTGYEGDEYYSWTDYYYEITVRDIDSFSISFDSGKGKHTDYEIEMSKEEKMKFIEILNEYQEMTVVLR